MSKKEVLLNLIANVYYPLKFQLVDWAENIFYFYLLLVFLPLHRIPVANRPCYRIQKISSAVSGPSERRFILIYTGILIAFFVSYGWAFIIWCASVIGIVLLNKLT
jgi:hypothetical protein